MTTDPPLHPAAEVVINASPRGGAYVSDDDAAQIAAAVLRWAANQVAGIDEHGTAGWLDRIADEVAPVLAAGGGA